MAYGKLDSNDPAIALALAIIERAVRDWKVNSGEIHFTAHANCGTCEAECTKAGIKACGDLNELRMRQIERARMRNEVLLPFFHGEWFDYLFESATEEIDKGEMFKALGIPRRHQRTAADRILARLNG